MIRWLHIKVITVSAWLLRKYLRSPRCMRFLRKHPRFAWLPGPKILPLVRLAVRYDDAKRVLDLHRNYAVPYLEKMDGLGARFVLGLDQSEIHSRQRDAIWNALAPIARKEVRRDSYAAAERALAGKSRVEIVHGLTDAVLQATVGRHLGTGEATPKQLDAARMVFRQIFINPFNSPDIVEDSERDARYLLAYVGDVVQTRDAELRRGAEPGGTVVDTLLDGYIRGGADPHLISLPEVTSQVVGLLVAWAASVSRSVAYAVDALLDQPDALRRAGELARLGDDKGMWELLQEALRWQPPVPAIERLCVREGPVHGETVRRERDVSVVLTAVTMDKQGYPEPRRFGLARGSQDNLTFGHGLHRCLGFEIAREQMSGIALSLLRRGDVRRVCELELVGPYPDRLEVTMEAAG